MKVASYCLLACFLLLISSVSSYGEESTRSLYNQRKLSIQTERGLSTHSHTTILPGKWAASASTYSTVRSWERWYPYQGFQRISEVKFLRIAGYSDQAEKAEAYHRRTDVLRAITITSLLIGLGGSLVGAWGFAPLQGEENYALGVGGLVVGTAALIVACVYRVQLRSRRFNWTPLPLALDIADEYNLKLKAELDLR